MRLKFICVSLLFLVGCSTVPVTNTELSNRTIANSEERLEWIGALSEGVDTTLNNNDVPASKVLNTKIRSVAAKPTPEQIQKVLGSLSDQKKMTELDATISNLIEEKRAIEVDSRKALDDLSKALAKANADKKSAEDELSALKNPFTAISYGIKTLVKRFLWTITGLGIVFLLLRTFAASNPIAAAIFDAVQHIVAYVIKAISALFPKAVAFGSRAFQQRDRTLSVLVDAIETLKPTDTIDDLKSVLAEDMDKADKRDVEEIQRRLGWK